MRFELACSFSPGDHFVEDVSGYQMYFVVATEPRVFEEGGHRKVEWTASGGGHSATTYFLITEGMEHYGPKIYQE